MSFFNANSPPGSPTSALRTPANKRISLPASDRLSTITESGRQPAPRPSTSASAAPTADNTEPEPASPPYSRVDTGRSRPITPVVPPRSILRNSPYNNEAAGVPSSAAVSTRTAPPAYTWRPEPIDPGERIDVSGDQEKLDELRRRATATGRTRGGWGRMALIIAIVLLLVIGLAVGLGVGLTVGRRNNNDDSSGNSQSTTTSTPPPQQFPLGQYSFVTNLRSAATNCTSNPNTWRCYPYSFYDPSNQGSVSTSQSVFNWVITSNSSTYATNSSGPTTNQGVPANLTISSTSNPFSVIFQNQAVNYISSQANSSDARLTFSFTTSKSVIPSAPLTSDNSASECFFNSTVFTATLYLRAPAKLPTTNMQAMDTTGSQWQNWPAAVEVQQESPGGQDVPACYSTTSGGAVGSRITTGLQPQSGNAECLCDYSNF